MSTGRQPPMGTPQLSTHAGLTPQMSIVDADGRPTMFFFRWLLTIGGAALAASDSSILEAFDPGADAALTESAVADALDAAAIAAEASLTESAIADALDAAGIAAGFDDDGAARADLAARIEALELAGALRTGGDETGPSADQRALEALLMADAPAVPAVPAAFLADTLANWTAANYNAANYANGQQFVVTTWQVTYAVEAGVWRYIAGVYIAPAAARPATAFNGAALGAADAGLRFLASDTDVYQYWNGAAWVVIANGAGVQQTITNPAIQLEIGGSAAGITASQQICSCIHTGKHVLLSITIVLTSKGAGAGTVTLQLGAIPLPALTGNGVLSDVSGINLGGSGVLVAVLGAGSTSVIFEQWTSTGVAVFSDTNITNNLVFNLLLQYQST